MASQSAAVVVEIDALRTAIDGWQEDDGSRLEARRLAVDVIDAHLRRGFDVMVPQYLGRTEFIEELARTANGAGTELVEVQLRADEDELVARFDARRAKLSGSEHPEHEVDDVRAAISEAMGRLELIARDRPETTTIAAHDEDSTLGDLTAVLDRRRP